MTQLIKTVNKVKRQINPRLKVQGILLTLVDNRTNMARASIETVRKAYGAHIPIFKSEIPQGVAAQESTTRGCSVFAYAPTSKVAVSYLDFAKEVEHGEGQRVRVEAAKCR
jgi:chromosome partitioning protein